MKNAKISMHTIVAPTGDPPNIEIKSPRLVQTTENIADDIVTERKLLNIHIDANAGNTTSAEIRSDPTKFIANTTIIAMIIAIKRLYFFVLIPVAAAKLSSNVTTNILL